VCHPEVPPGAVQPRVRVEEIEIAVGRGDRMPALLALPDGASQGAVLVINDVFGRSPFYEHLARRLASAGYVALDPEFFFREGPLPEPTREAAMARRARSDEGRILGDLGAASEWLRERADIQRVGTIGFCMGGTFALDLAALRDDIAATVSYYGFPASPQRERAAPRPLDLADRMRGPILGHWGDRDEGVGVENVEALRRRLAGAGVAHEFHLYPGLGHGFLKAFLDDESSSGYAQACESWRRTLDFYRRHLAF
jgi:dienelactone hydrolase